MSAPLPLLEALLSLSALLAILGIATAVCKMQRAVRIRRRQRLEAAARPHVLSILVAEEPAAGAPDVDGALERTFERLASSLLPKLRGADREALVGVLEELGTLERARRRATRVGAVGRARAADLLGAAGDEHALPALVALLDDRDPDVRIVAARALGKLGAPAVAPLLAALESTRPLPAGVVIMALVHAGADGADGLLAGLELERSPQVRAVAAELLGQLGVLAAVDRLIDTLQDDPDVATRAAAARSLGRLGLPDAGDALAAALTDAPERELRIAAAQALGRIGGEPAVTTLSSALAESDHELARAAAGGLTDCGRPGLAVLESGADDPVTGPIAREALCRIALTTARRRELTVAAA